MISPEFSRYAICYEGIQRILRNSVVQRFRDRLLWENIAKLFKPEDLLQAKSNALSARESGRVETPFVDDFDVIGVNHFFNIFEVHFNSIFETSSDSASRNMLKQSMLGWAREIKNYRDPGAHPGEHDLSFADAFRQLDAAKRILSHINPDDASKIAQLLDNLLEPDPEYMGRVKNSQERLEGMLPSRDTIVPSFVGRRDELKALWIWLRDPRRPLWALAGDGGKGKSSIAFQFAEEVTETAPEPINAVLWLTAKRRAFQEGRTIDISATAFSDLNTALDNIMTQLGGGSDEQSWPLDEKREFTLDFLNDYPVLLVADDLDSLEGMSEDAIHFFTFEVPLRAAETKVLITSRRNLFGMGAATTNVVGFTPEDGHRYVKLLAKRYGLDSTAFPSTIITQILNACDYSPLYVDDLLRLSAIGEPIANAIKQWKDHAGAEARKYALGREFDLLSADAKAALVAACIPQDPPTLEELRVTSNQTPDQIRSSVAELQRLFLIPRPTMVEGVERFAVNSNTRELILETERGTDLYLRLEAAYRQLSDQVGMRSGRVAVEPIRRQAVVQMQSRDQTAAESTLLSGLDHYPDNVDLLSALGWVYKSWQPHRRVQDARGAFRRCIDLRCSDTKTYYHAANLEIDEQEFSSAISITKLGRQAVNNDRELLQLEGLAHSLLGRSYARQDFVSYAEKEFNEALKLFQMAKQLPEELRGYRERELNSKAFRGIALAYEAKIRLRDLRIQWREIQGLAEQLVGVLTEWVSEHPDDSIAVSEQDRIGHWLRSAGLVRDERPAMDPETRALT